MIFSTLLLLQATVAPPAIVTERTVELYQPYRQCLLAEAASIDVASKTDETIVDEARRRCTKENLHAGSNALFVEIKAVGSKDEAINRVAAYRAAIESEAVAAARSKLAKSK